MGCNSSYMNANSMEIEGSKIYGLLDELETGKLPDNYGSGYDKRVYSTGIKRSELDVLADTLCSKLQKIDVTKYSLEMQMWWREHQKADKERIEKELKEKQNDSDRELAISKLTPHERKLLGL